MNPQDPLSQLRDIHLPMPISWWPPAPGWWALAAVLLILLGILGLWFWRRHQRNAYRRSALAELQTAGIAFQTDNDALLYAQRLNQILKRVALIAWPQIEVANLSGHSWLAFLDSHWPDNYQDAKFADCGLDTLPYVEHAQAELVELSADIAASWFNLHQVAQR
jgi:hypothetical protein